MSDRARARREIERWFVSRGVPQLIEGYGDEQHMDARATPLIAAWLLIGTVVWWARRPDLPPAWNALSVLLAVAFMASVYVAVSALRGRRPFERPRTWDLRDIALFGLLPAVPAAIIQGPLSGVVVLGNALLGVGAIYLAVAFGLLEIGWWATRRIGSQLEHIVALVSRTLPLLLILVVFLLFAAEMWEAAHAMHGGEVALVLALFAFVALLLVVTTLRAEVQRIEARDDWDAVLEQTRDTPAATLADELPRDPRAMPRLTWLQRANVSLLIVVSQLVQSAFVAVVVAAFLVAFGLIALPASVQEGWVGGELRLVAEFSFLGELRTLSAELLIVAAVLGGIVGLYFTGLALTDASYRAEYFARVIAEVEQIVSVRAVYLAAGPRPDS